ANRFADEPIGPGALDIGGVLSGQSMAEIAALVVIEACVGETVAAALAQEQRAVATDPQAIAALDRIARDEADHAELGWAFVSWALREGGRPVLEAVAAAFDSALRSRAEDPTPPDDDDGQRAALHRFGRLTSNERRSARQRALESVVRPCSQRLLALASTGATNPHLRRAATAV
ncbi:MAG: ferritin-like domain-containing protein, partial [Polyangiaceae bacterium]